MEEIVEAISFLSQRKKKRTFCARSTIARMKKGKSFWGTQK